MKQVNWSQLAPLILFVLLIALAIPALSVKKDSNVEHNAATTTNADAITENKRP